MSRKESRPNGPHGHFRHSYGIVHRGIPAEQSRTRSIVPTATCICPDFGLDLAWFAYMDENPLSTSGFSIDQPVALREAAAAVNSHRFNPLGVVCRDFKVIQCAVFGTAYTAGVNTWNTAHKCSIAHRQDRTQAMCCIRRGGRLSVCVSRRLTKRRRPQYHELPACRCIKSNPHFDIAIPSTKESSCPRAPTLRPIQAASFFPTPGSQLLPATITATDGIFASAS